MTIENYKNYPDRCLEDSYPVKKGEGIDSGMFVKLDSNMELVKATGATGEYAMPAMNKGSDKFFENANKVNVAKENCSLETSYFKADAYTPHCLLQVSDSVGEEGYLKKHDGAAGRPIVGRYIGKDTLDIGGVTEELLIFDLVRT